MALKNSIRTKSQKIWIAVGVTFGFLVLGGVINMFVTGFGTWMGVAGTPGHQIITWAVYIISLAIAALIIWLGWLDPTPEQQVAIAAKRKAIKDAGGSATPRFDEERERDRAAMLAVLAEGDEPVSAASERV